MHNLVYKNSLHSLELLLRLDVFSEHSRLLGTENKLGNTPLHLAAITGRIEALHRFLVAGSKVDTANIYGLTPAHSAVIFGRDDAVWPIARLGLHVSDRLGNGLLHYASFFDHADIARNLIKAGWDKDAQNDNGDTPLHVAARSGSLRALGTLI
ncbi:ankyrin, partial [Melanomma pulvis-pyrius CBS 109.77]